MSGNVVASRSVLILHDQTPHVLNVESYLVRCVGARFSVIPKGDIGQPIQNSDLQPLLFAPDAGRAFLAIGALPISRHLRQRNAQDGLHVRSLLPIPHPLARIVTHYRKRVGFAATLQTGEAPGIELFVREALAETVNSIPAANFMTAHLLGGGMWETAIDGHLVRETIEMVHDCTTPLPADFESISWSKIFAALLDVGVPAAPEALVVADGRTELVEQITFLRQTLPADLFAELCARNKADLALFAGTIEQALDRAPLSDSERAGAQGAVAAAAELSSPGRASKRSAAVAETSKGFFNTDPVLGWCGKPLAQFPMKVFDREVIMETDAEGRRPVIGQPPRGKRTVALYGCSYTFGWSVTADETFASRIQATLPDWRIENHSVGGFGIGHNLLQLQRETRFETPDIVTFCYIPALAMRAAAGFEYIANFQQHHLIIPIVRTYPQAYIDDAGDLAFRNIRFWRPEIVGVEHHDFELPRFYLDLLAIRIFRRADEIVRGKGGRFFVALLRERPSEHLMGLLRDAHIPVVDVGLVGDEWTNLPDDAHPNPGAHVHFAERIVEYLKTIA